MPIVAHRVAWSVGMSVGLSPSKSCKRKHLLHDYGPLPANTVLCSFNTIQPFGYRLDLGLQCIYSFMLFVQYDQSQLSTSCMKLVFERPVIRQ